MIDVLVFERSAIVTGTVFDHEGRPVSTRLSVRHPVLDGQDVALASAVGTRSDPVFERRDGRWRTHVLYAALRSDRRGKTQAS